MLTTQFFSGMAIFMSILAYFVYVYSIYKGKSKPHIYSWFSWFIVILIGGLAQHQVDESGSSSMVLYVTAFCYLTIALYACFMKNKNITRNDTYIFAGALCAIPMWLLTKNPLWALFILMIIDVLCFCPTIRKTYHKPYSEDLAAYSFAALSYTFMIFAVVAPTMESIIYPIFLASLEFSFVLFVLIIRFYRPKA